MTVSRLTHRADPPPFLARAATTASWPTRPLGDLRRIARDRWADRRPARLRPAAGLCCLALAPLALALRSGLAGDRAVTAGLVAVTAILAALLPASARPRPGRRAAGAASRRRLVRRAGAVAPFALLTHLVTSALDDRAVPPWLGVGAVITALAAAAVARHASPAVQAAAWTLALAATVAHVHQLADAAADVVTTGGLVILGLALATLLAFDAMSAVLTTRTRCTVEALPAEGPGGRLVLVAARGRTPAFHPGHFAWLRLGHPWGTRLPRPVTIAPGDRPDRITLTPEAGDRDVAALEPGRRVYVDGPHDPVDEPHQGALLFLAGAGDLAPVIGLLRLQADRGDTRPHCVVLRPGGAPDPQVRRALRRLTERLDLDVVELRTGPPPRWGRRPDRAVLADALRHHPVLAAAHAYVHATPAHLDDLKGALVDLGLSPRRIHVQPLEQQAQPLAQPLPLG